MNSAAVEILLQDVEDQLSSYNILLDEAYKSIEEKPVTDEEVKAFYGYKPKSRELMEAGRASVKNRDKYKAKKDLDAEFCFQQQGEKLTRLMEREAEDTIFEDGGAREANAIAGAISQHIEAFNIIASARARELYTKYEKLRGVKGNSEQQQQSDKPKLITGLCNIASYLSISENTLRTAIKNGYYNGFIYRVGNSKWQLDTEKYEQSKYIKL